MVKNIGLVKGIHTFVFMLVIASSLVLDLFVVHMTANKATTASLHTTQTASLHSNHSKSTSGLAGIGLTLTSNTLKTPPFTKPTSSTQGSPTTAPTQPTTNTGPVVTNNAPISNATPTFNNYPMYMYDPEHNNYNPTETAITTTTAPNLKQLWNIQVGPPNQTPFYKYGVSDQPVEYNNVLYWGSWDGNMHATNISTHQDIWTTNLGVTTDANCSPTQAGVGSTATVRQVSINGVQTPVVFVGGGDANVYALNANTGAVIWKTPLGQSPNTFLWSPVVLSNGYVYIGKSSFGDCPLVHAGLFQLNWSTGAIAHVFNTEPVTPNNCTGSSIWGAPTIDRSKNTVYFATGNPGWCPNTSNVPASGVYGYSIVEVQANNVSTLVGDWQVPQSQLGADNDFGSTPTLFYAGSKPMVGIGGKNGFYYAFQRDNLGAGPVWQDQIAIGGNCPDCGDGTLSAAAWDGTYLYVAGGKTTIAGVSAHGAVRAVNPSTGAYIWEHPFTKGAVLGAVSAIPGVIVVDEANSVDVINSKTGAELIQLTPPGNSSVLDGPDMIINGVLYFGDLNGNLYAYQPM